ncbi:hypothetical protein HanHA300_Chr09g0331921 [Helianthus annuus]|nr:hypothetical protein HanHA300_Chr09g0331921 [Helianthus annuus]KAJ0535913.1 hypothetical protein HanIR_Chr09g0435751 [Helianthus annuus]KAJ0543647.1 hypothetical protein HanHA89_Chr09g0352901 [Helianthus annuus]KAJ0708703.1 hypothetical protein HanLR1_Chr09g0332231 [Helianthus annuus]
MSYLHGYKFIQLLSDPLSSQLIIPQEITMLAGLDESLRIIIKVIDGHEWDMEIQALKMSLQKGQVDKR